MAEFRFETEVKTTVTLEYFIEADSLEEALEQLQNGEHREKGEYITEEIDWGSEVITIEEKLEDKD